MICSIVNVSANRSNIIWGTELNGNSSKVIDSVLNQMDDPSSKRPFHPKDPAHGTRNYDVGVLSKNQKRKLNLRKATVRNENDIYLKAHPEIKALISLLLKCVLRSQPNVDVHETMGEFFNRPRRQVLADLLDYMLHIDQSEDVEYGLRAAMKHSSISVSNTAFCNR
ncbi:uncharacterized protein LOC144477136 [Augochlora pura]